MFGRDWNVICGHKMMTHGNEGGDGTETGQHAGFDREDDLSKWGER